MTSITPAMNTLVRTIGFVTLLIASASAQERKVPELEVLLKKYEAEVRINVGAKHESALTELNRTYVAALERALKKAQEGGRLEEALAIKGESELMNGGGSVPTDDEGAPPSLKNLRAIYQQSFARIEQDKNAAVAPLTKALTSSLDQLVATLTQAGRLDDAVVVKQKKERMSAAVGLTGGVHVSSQSEFTNSLGMKFMPVPGTDVQFCIHETRRSDYASYAAEVAGVDASWKNQSRGGIPAGMDDNHPVVGVSWSDAKAFCEWLSKKEGRVYRLPTDREWSYAVGVGRKEKKEMLPDALSKKVAGEFPWGGRFPPTKSVGNYADASFKQKNPSAECIENYSDGFVSTAPVMSFPPNKLGIYDLGGNVWEWCEDWYNAAKVDRVSRGGAWTTRVEAELLSSNRDHTPPGRREPAFGFRCVVEVKK